MYEFSDYFSIENAGLPYLNPGEELEDYLRLLDMQLENYLEYKGMGSEQRLFSRGLVITESELKSYFEMPPYFRERDICNPLLSAAVNAAYEYIRNRTEATKTYIGLSEPTQNQTAASDTDEIPQGMELLRFNYLKETFDLDPTEMMSILLALSIEIDRRYERIYGFMQDDISKRVPTIGLLYTLMARVTPRESADEAMPIPLNEKMYTFFFIRKEDEDGLSAPLILQPLVKKLLMGTINRKNNYVDVFSHYTENNGIPVFYEDSAKEIEYILSKEKSSWQDTPENELSGRSVYLANNDEETAQHLLYRYCATHQENLYVLDMQQLFGLQDGVRDLCLSELLMRMKLFNGRLCIRCITEDNNKLTDTADQFIKVRNTLKFIIRNCAPKYVFLFGQKEEPAELAAMLIPYIKIPEASVALRTEIWNYFLTSEKAIRLSKNVNIPDLADFYEIPYGEIHKAVGHVVATSRTKRGSTVNKKMILESLRQLNQVDFSGLATYINPVYTWKDITITDQQKEVLQTACSRCRLRNRIGEGWGLKNKSAYGNGISLLLYGPPGTGKTMAAQVIANELELPLYRVDISQITSKYIGETEKNMAIIFKAASSANVILFFDEADALFSKRTEVSDSHDKYANNETAYLLQKIEEYNGMSILATNYYNNFDDAFVRRITFAVHMQSPDKDTRYSLWTSILPKSAKMARNIDFRFLAEKFELSGSNIKAILFNAAYMAGAEEKPIGPEHITRAMQYEFNKLGKLVNKGDFGKYSIYLQ